MYRQSVVVGRSAYSFIHVVSERQTLFNHGWTFPSICFTCK